MRTRYFVLVVGIVYILVGLLGFVPNLLTLPAGAPALTTATGYGYLLGLFPVNLWHNLVHLAIGIWGIVAYLNVVRARQFAQILAIFYGLLAILGLIPATSTLFGLVPLFSHNIWLHALTALIAAYFGYMTPVERPATMA